MKKYILFLSIGLLLASCGNDEQLQEAKQELLGNSGGESVTQIQDVSSVEQTKQSSSLIEIVTLDANSPLKFNEISERSLSSGEAIISGIADGDVDKIEVFFSNSNSDFPDDRYTLQTFKKGDGDFKYIASSRNKVLDFGKNEYIFRAYSGITENETKITIELPKQGVSLTPTGVETELIGTQDNLISIDFPVSTAYGEPVRLGEASFTYSDIQGFEVEKKILGEVSCETLTEYLQESINTWFFWNTCRDIIKDKGIKFNVIRLQGEEYVYERHYIDFKNGLYGVYELETGVGVTSENISDKNTELKEVEYSTIEVVDTLMRDILQS